MNEELKKEIIDEKTGIRYVLKGDLYFPDIEAPKQENFELNKYGRMRLNYLKEYKRGMYEELMMKGKLPKHLKEVQEKAKAKLELKMNELKYKSGLTEEMKNTDMLYWVGTMNMIKAQAEEIVMNEIIYQ